MVVAGETTEATPGRPEASPRAGVRQAFRDWRRGLRLAFAPEVVGGAGALWIAQAPLGARVAGAPQDDPPVDAAAKIRVLLVDDHALVRAGLGRLLAGIKGFEIVGAATNGGEAVELARRELPDVVLMDIEMPVLDGIAATRRIVGSLEGVAVVVLTSFPDRERILGALDAGAVGYMLKDAEPDELARGIRIAARSACSLRSQAARTRSRRAAATRPCH
jgi:CheY-like chemotaxis protein